MRQPEPGIIRKNKFWEERIDFKQIDSKQSEINEPVVKIIFYCENYNIIIPYILMPEAYLEP